MKSKMRLFLIAGVVGMLTIFIVGQTLAATLYSYNLTVPKFGGSVPTNNVVKQTSSSLAYVYSHLIGGDYDLSIRLENVGNQARSGWYRINDYTTIYYATTAAKGEQVHMRLKSDLLDPVNIQAIGLWSPDSP